MVDEYPHKYKRSEYLKNGCRECKRRKIKCDEFVNPPKEAFSVTNHQGRPLCWNCTRLKKICEYPRKGERVPRVSRKFLIESENKVSSPQLSVSLVSSTSSTYDIRTAPNQQPSIHIAPEDVKNISTIPLITPTNTENPGVMDSSIPQNLSLSYPNYGPSSTNIHTIYGNLSRGLYNGTHYGFTNSIQFNNAPAATFNAYPTHRPDPSFMAQNQNISDHMSMQLPFQRDNIPNNSILPNSSLINPTPIEIPQFANLSKPEQLQTPIYSFETLNQSLSFPKQDSQVPQLMREALPLVSTISSESTNTGALSVPANIFDPSDLAGLASDLNNMVSDMMFDISPDGRTPNVGNSNRNFRDLSTNLDNFRSNSSATFDNNENVIPKNVTLKEIPQLRPREQQYLESFYHGFAVYILPYEVYDPVLKVDLNPIRDILLIHAAKEPVLLAAILSVSSRISHSQTSNSQDEDAYYQYLLRCLKILGPALGQCNRTEEDEHSFSTEGILLTVLLLTSANAANFNQKWRTHLKGAKNLLLKMSRDYKTTNSKIIVFCKFWFASFEILAGFSLKLGGTLNEPEELDLLLNFDSPHETQVLKDMGLVLDNGFNFLYGFHNNLVPTFRDIIKLLNKVRNDPKRLTDDTREYLRLLSSLEGFSQCEFVNRSCIASIADFPNGIPNGLLLEQIHNGVSPLIISWMDLSHQLYCLGAKVTILRDFLGLKYDSPQMQALANQFADWFSYIAQSNIPKKSKFPYIVMVLWPLQVFGMMLIRNEHQDLVVTIYSCAKEKGAGCADHFKNRLKGVWNNRDNGIRETFDDDVDIVNY